MRELQVSETLMTIMSLLTHTHRVEDSCWGQHNCSLNLSSPAGETRTGHT